MARRRIAELCGSAIASLSPWPGARAAVERFLLEDIYPAFQQFDPHLGACARSAV
jgi:hypothetical protein